MFKKNVPENKVTVYQEFDDSKNIVYYDWIFEKEEYQGKDGKEKVVYGKRLPALVYYRRAWKRKTPPLDMNAGIILFYGKRQARALVYYRERGNGKDTSTIDILWVCFTVRGYARACIHMERTTYIGLLYGVEAGPRSVYQESVERKDTRPLDRNLHNCFYGTRLSPRLVYYRRAETESVETEKHSTIRHELRIGLLYGTRLSPRSLLQGERGNGKNTRPLDMNYVYRSALRSAAVRGCFSALLYTIGEGNGKDTHHRHGTTYIEAKPALLHTIGERGNGKDTRPLDMNHVYRSALRHELTYMVCFTVRLSPRLVYYESVETWERLDHDMNYVYRSVYGKRLSPRSAYHRRAWKRERHSTIDTEPYIGLLYGERGNGKDARPLDMNYVYRSALRERGNGKDTRPLDMNYVYRSALRYRLSPRSCIPIGAWKGKETRPLDMNYVYRSALRSALRYEAKPALLYTIGERGNGKDTRPLDMNYVYRSALRSALRYEVSPRSVYYRERGNGKDTRPLDMNYVYRSALRRRGNGKDTRPLDMNYVYRSALRYEAKPALLYTIGERGNGKDTRPLDMNYVYRSALRSALRYEAKPALLYTIGERGNGINTQPLERPAGALQCCGPLSSGTERRPLKRARARRLPRSTIPTSIIIDKHAADKHTKLCLGGKDQSEAKNRGGRYGTAANRCSERIKNVKCMATPSQLKCMQLICASRCAIYKLQRDWCIRRSCTLTATYEARLK
ncbi:hypothetical protein EVAR_57714_1 [Eumeta japonica]|uniref:Uncharacterized protein n=1 Tax=Eumeta variegata TaxID=151549 RepID=A0A4C1Y778_EUMVA|nr:hypothetical protein EVAR_57714_1 [Eumeta japonica]